MRLVSSNPQMTLGPELWTNRTDKTFQVKQRTRHGKKRLPPVPRGAQSTSDIENLRQRAHINCERSHENAKRQHISMHGQR